MPKLQFVGPQISSQVANVLVFGAKGDGVANDSAAVVAAINSLPVGAPKIGGEVYFPPGTYLLSPTIVVPSHVKMNLGEATIKPATNGNLFQLKPGSQAWLGIIDTAGIAFSSACYYLSGSDTFSAEGRTTQIIGTSFKGGFGAGKGTAVFLDATTGNVYRVVGTELSIVGFEYGIRLFRAGTTGANWANGNHFTNVWGDGTRTFVSLDLTGGTDGQDLDGNEFLGLDYQWDATYSNRALFCAGRYNKFDIQVWDITGATGIEYSTLASLNNLITDLNETYVKLNALDNTSLFGNDPRLSISQIVPPSTGSSIQVVQPASTFLEWYFRILDATQSIEVNWTETNTLASRFIIKYSSTDVLIEMIKQTAGGALRPIVFGMNDVPGVGETRMLRFNTNGTTVVLNNNLTPDATTKAGIGVTVKAGAPVDGDFANPVDGLVVTDTTNNKIWTRIGGTWKGVVVA